MKKEVIIAIVLGLMVGLIVTYGVYRVQTAFTRPKNKTTAEKLAAPATTQASEAPTTIAILNPEEGSILADPKLQVTGTTTPNAHVVLFVNNADFISTSDETGAFTFSVTLEKGVTILRVHVLTEDGITTTAERMVVVSDLFDENPTISPSPEATPTAQ